MKRPIVNSIVEGFIVPTIAGETLAYPIQIDISSVMNPSIVITGTGPTFILTTFGEASKMSLRLHGKIMPEIDAIPCMIIQPKTA